jgi:methyl-accepting chemotaxis protein
VFVAIVIGVLGAPFWLARGIARRVLALIVVARRIGSNNFSQEAPVEGNDEIALLASTFNTMTANLRERMEAERVARARIEQLLKTIGETASNLASASSELLGGTTQQSASAQEQAAAVAQTVTTVDEVKQTTEQAAQRAKAAAESAQRAAEIGKIGRQAIDESVDAMANVKEQKSRTSHHFCLMGFKRHHSQSRQRTFT